MTCIKPWSASHAELRNANESVKAPAGRTAKSNQSVCCAVAPHEGLPRETRSLLSSGPGTAAHGDLVTELDPDAATR